MSKSVNLKIFKRVLVIAFVAFVVLTLIYICVTPMIMSIYFGNRIQSELPRIQAALDQQCVQHINASSTGFRIDDTGTTWSGNNQSELKISCRLYEYNNEWNCSC